MDTQEAIAEAQKLRDRCFDDFVSGKLDHLTGEQHLKILEQTVAPEVFAEYLILMHARKPAPVMA